MSYLSNALEELLDLRAMTAMKLAEITGIDGATISRWRSGSQISVSDADIEKLCGALAEDDQERAKLIAARMMDVRRGPGAELIVVRIKDQVMREDPVPYGTKLPPAQEEAFKLLRQNMADTDVRKIVMGTAELLARAKPKKS